MPPDTWACGLLLSRTDLSACNTTCIEFLKPTKIIPEAGVSSSWLVRLLIRGPETFWNAMVDMLISVKGRWNAYGSRLEWACARKAIKLVTLCQSSATAHRRSGSTLTAAPMLAKSSVPWQIIIRILCASQNDTPHLSYSTLQCFLPHRGGLLADRHGLQMPTQILRQHVQVTPLRTFHGGCYSCHTTKRLWEASVAGEEATTDQFVYPCINRYHHWQSCASRMPPSFLSDKFDLRCSQESLIVTFIFH